MICANAGSTLSYIWRDALLVPIYLKNDPTFDNEFSDPFFSAMGSGSRSEYSTKEIHQDGFVLTSGRQINLSQNFSKENDQSSNLTSFEIWHTGLLREIFLAISSYIRPLRPITDLIHKVTYTDE